MRISHPSASLIYKVIAALIVVFGVTSTALRSGAAVLMYYTDLSNLLCLAYFLVAITLLLVGRHRGVLLEVSPRWKGAVVLAITLTMVVYWVVLYPTGFFVDTNEFADVPPPAPGLNELAANYAVHLVVPLLTLFDWVLFDAKGRFRATDPFWWSLVPWLYYGLVIVLAHSGFRYTSGTSYPYYFLDPEVMGYALIVAIAVLSVFVLGLGYALVGTDRLLAWLATRRMDDQFAGVACAVEAGQAAAAAQVERATRLPDIGIV